MITFQKETFSEFLIEGKALVSKHHLEIYTGLDLTLFDVDFDAYSKIESAGKLEVYTARENGTLIGYTLWFISRHLHYKNSLTATSAAVFMNPKYRKGLQGYKLIKWSIEKLKSRQIQRILISVKPTLDFGKLLERLGASYFEKTYSIVLD